MDQKVTLSIPRILFSSAAERFRIISINTHYS